MLLAAPKMLPIGPALSAKHQSMHRSASLFLSLAIAAASGLGQAAAQSSTSLASDGGSGWRIECANDGKALDCRAINRVNHRDTRELIAAVAIRIPPDTKKPAVIVQLPLGIQVTDKITLRVDESQPEGYPIQTCTQTGCLVGAPASDALISALRGGRELKVAFQNLAKQTITVSMPLAGFALAYDKIK
jgi:invasion protein IalB